MEAARFRGATSPNPSVGAVLLDADGRALAVAAHQKAGTFHAEVAVIDQARAAGTLARATALIVTLEPCNHQGRTPPCTDAIAASGIRRVVIGARDPNPHVSGGGADRLRALGLSIEVIHPESDTGIQCARLIAPFKKAVQTGQTYLTVKQALRRENGAWTAFPLEGQKTFTRADSLTLAHELRKRSDAILTGSETILLDQPQFTVRRVPDHPGKVRTLVIFDRRGRVPDEYLTAARARGFRPRISKLSVAEELGILAQEGCVEALLEAGPVLTQSVLDLGIWDESVVIRHEDARDEIEHVYRNH